MGASIIQEIESDDTRTTSSIVTEENPSQFVQPIKNLDRDRERLLSRIIDKRQTVDLQQYAKYVTKHIREYEEEIKKAYKSTTISSETNLPKVPRSNENPRWSFAGSLFFIGTSLTTIGKSNNFIITNKNENE